MVGERTTKENEVGEVVFVFAVAGRPTDDVTGTDAEGKRGAACRASAWRKVLIAGSRAERKCLCRNASRGGGTAGVREAMGGAL